MSALPNEAASEITKYFDLLFGSRMGYVYIPTLNRESNDWQQHFFLWPNNRSSAVDFVVRNSPSVDVFVAPALFKTDENAQKDNVLGTHVAYVDIDGTYKPEGTPVQPSFVVRSSSKDHLHCYWLMDSFNTSVESIEDANFKLAYRMEADNSGWDATQVLRPPLTMNHKRGKLTSDILMNPKPLKASWAQFSGLELPENARNEPIRPHEITEIPNVEAVLKEYKFPSEFYDLFRKSTIEAGKRSGALMALAYYGAELQCSNEEILAVLLNADERWGKFKGRKDRIQRLLDAVTRARTKYPFSGMPDSPFRVESFYSLTEREIDVEWAIEELLDRQGLGFIVGPPGCGKTQLSIQLGLSLGAGAEFIGLNPPNNVPQKTLFLSKEMGERQVSHIGKKFVPHMGFTEEQQELARKNFLTVFMKDEYHLSSTVNRDYLRKLIRDERPTGLLIDSFGTMINADMNDDQVIRETLGSLTNLAREENVFFWFIHHNRKAQVGNKKPNSLGDVYGSQYVTSIASLVMSMWPKDRTKEISVLKNRLGLLQEGFTLQHSMDLTFTLVPKTVTISSGKEEEKEKDGPSADMDFQ